MQNFEWYVRGAIFKYREECWSELGDPIEWVGEDGNIPILKTNTLEYAKYKNGNWTYSPNWSQERISIITNVDSTVDHSNIINNNSSQIIVFNNGLAYASFKTKKPHLYLSKKSASGINSKDSIKDMHIDDDPENPNMYNSYAEMCVLLSMHNPPPELEYLVEYLNNMSDNLVSLDEITNLTEQIDLTKPISKEILNTLSEATLKAMELSTKQLWNTSLDILKNTALSTCEKITNIFKSN